MATIIISPESALIEVSSNMPDIRWDTSLTQTAFEIQYKLKTSLSWSSCGKITSTNKYYNTSNLYNFINVDFLNITIE